MTFQGPELHDRATRGEVLTQEERTVLEAWYHRQDEAEMRLLQSGGTVLLSDTLGDIQAVLSRIKETASQIQALDLQNASLRQEIAAVQQRLATKVA